MSAKRLKTAAGPGRVELERAKLAELVADLQSELGEPTAEELEWGQHALAEPTPPAPEEVTA